MLDSEEKTGLSFQLLASSVDHSSLALIGSSVRDAVGFTFPSALRLSPTYIHRFECKICPPSASSFDRSLLQM